MRMNYKELSIFTFSFLIGVALSIIFIIYFWEIMGFNLIETYYLCILVSVFSLSGIYVLNNIKDKKFIVATQKEWLIFSFSFIGGTLFTITCVSIGDIMFVFMFIACILLMILFFVFNAMWERTIPDPQKKILIDNPDDMVTLLETFRTQYNRENEKIYYGIESIDFYYTGWKSWLFFIFIFAINFLKDIYNNDSVTGFFMYLMMYLIILLLLERILGNFFRSVGEKRKNRILKESRPVVKYKLYSSPIDLFDENRYILVFDFAENCVYEVVMGSSDLPQMTETIEKVHRYLETAQKLSHPSNF